MFLKILILGYRYVLPQQSSNTCTLVSTSTVDTMSTTRLARSVLMEATASPVRNFLPMELKKRIVRRDTYITQAVKSISSNNNTITDNHEDIVTFIILYTDSENFGAG
ncbi:hypothetical protein CHS0354_033561, partial [Potamilus streckersoni]